MCARGSDGRQVASVPNLVYLVGGERVMQTAGPEPVSVRQQLLSLLKVPVRQHRRLVTHSKTSPPPAPCTRTPTALCERSMPAKD